MHGFLLKISITSLQTVLDVRSCHCCLKTANGHLKSAKFGMSIDRVLPLRDSYKI
jgi:hypothetical protein